MTSSRHRTIRRSRLTRLPRLLAVTAPLLLAAACAGSDGTSLTTGSTPPDITAPSVGATSTESASSSEPGSTTTTSTTAPATTTSDAATTTTSRPPSTPPTTSTSPSTTTAPDQPEQTIPPAIRGTWRISDDDTVTPEECDANRNFGQVLTVRADGYSYFEAGGVLIEVIERDESRVDATFETTAGGPNTSVERVTLDAQDAGATLIVNDAQPGIVRLVRCPPVGQSATPESDARPLELESFDLARVRDAGIESIGCSVRPSDPDDVDPVFFANGDGGFMVVDGQSITLANSTSPDLDDIPTLEADLTFSQNGYAVTFVTVDPAEPNSIESTEQDVTLAVATPDGRRTRVDGIAFCGV